MARSKSVLAFTAGWLLIASATAGAVVAVGKSNPKTQNTALSSPGPGASASSTPSATPNTAVSTIAASTTTVPTTPPKPTPTVTGEVSGSSHTGDLRYFLLPVPSDAGVLGDLNGSVQTKADVVARYGGSADVVSALDQLGFKAAVHREYQTGDAAYHVAATLMQFGSQSSASTWVSFDQAPADWKPFAVSGYSGAKAYDIAPYATGALAHMRVLYYKGDTVFEILITGQDPLDHSVLLDRMTKQMAHLTTGA